MSAASTLDSARIIGMASDACVELMHDYGVELSKRATGATLSDGPVLFGVIGFVGRGVRATCLLGAEQALVDASRRSGNRSRDWIAELANQLVGRIKMKLLACSVNVTMTTPLALSGVQFTPLPRHGQEPVLFDSERGMALLWLELETEKDFVLAPEQPTNVVPGDLLF
jgi:CheY-specific phosphatase CheX